MTFNIINTIAALGLLLLLFSCTKEIEIDLNSVSPQLVIDGEISLEEHANITISYTTDYFDPEDPVYEDKATVTIKNTAGESEQLVYSSKGQYNGSILKGVSGETYTVIVKIEDKTYEASSKIMTPSKITGTEVKKYNGSFGGDDSYEMDLIFTNNPEEENYYMLNYIYEEDGDQEEDRSMVSWEYWPRETSITYTGGWRTFDAGSEVSIKLYSIDEGTYDFFESLEDINGDGGPGGMTPYNPKSNFGEGVLGYFRAWSKDMITVSIPEE